MIEPDRKLAWSGLFVLIVIAIELALFLIVGPANHGSDSGTDQKANYWVWEWLTSAAFWTAAFTGALTVSTYFLWRATRRAAEIAGRALTEHERPWIFRDLVTVRWRQRPSFRANDWEISLKWKNVGRAPATLVDFVFKIQDVDTLPAIPDYSVCDHLPVIDAMPAKDTVEYDTQAVGLAVPGTKKGQPIEYVFWGRLRYREMNGILHTSGYALRLSPMFATAMSHNSDAYNYYN